MDGSDVKPFMGKQIYNSPKSIEDVQFLLSNANVGGTIAEVSFKQHELRANFSQIFEMSRQLAGAGNLLGIVAFGSAVKPPVQKKERGFLGFTFRSWSFPNDIDILVLTKEPAKRNELTMPVINRRWRWREYGDEWEYDVISGGVHYLVTDSTTFEADLENASNTVHQSVLDDGWLICGSFPFPLKIGAWDNYNVAVG